MRRIAILTLRDKYEMYDDQLRNEFEDTEILQFGADNSFDRLIRKAIELEQEGFDAIICRGYTENIISRHLSIPIVLVEPDMTDVLYAVTNSGVKPGDEIVILLHEKNNLLKYSDLPHYLKKVFGLDAMILTYTSVNDFHMVVDQGIRTGRWLFSSNLALMAAEAAGRPNSLFCVGVNAMRAAAVEAIKIIDIRRKDADQNERVRTILDHSEEGIVSLDETMTVRLINQHAREVLGIQEREAPELMGVRDGLPGLDWDNIFDQEYERVVSQTASGSRVVVNTKPILNTWGRKEVFIFFREAAHVVADEKRVRAELHKKGRVARFHLEDIKGESPAIVACKEKTRQCAKFEANVLLYGESGVGKELFAQCIHNESARKNEAFYAINCASLPATLLESELFGYSDGAFTGARKGGKAGIFEMAHRGTVFLDEIGEMPLASQSALLRVIQEREVRRIGDDAVIPVDVRIIAASNKDIYQEVKEKRFREDLFYRLSAVFLHIPPLRQRERDVLLLMDGFIREASLRNGIPYTGSLTEDARQYLLEYRWNGNIRELENFVQRLFVSGFYDRQLNGKQAEELLRNTAGDISGDLRRDSRETVPNAVSGLEPEGQEALPPELAGHVRVSREDVLTALRKTGGNRTETARLLGISRTQLWRYIKKIKES